VVEIQNEKIKGSRKNRLIRSALDLKAWLDIHPGRNNKDSFLFCRLDNPQKAIGEDNIIRLVRAVAKKSGFGKLHTHLFRHSRATELAEKGFTQYDLENLMGWTRSSIISATYVHGFDSNQKLLEKEGIVKPGEEKNFDKIKSQICPWEDCRAENSLITIFCVKCHRPLDAAVAQRAYDEQTKAIKVLEKLDNAKLSKFLDLFAKFEQAEKKSLL
jgi:predicted transcriptional regulator